MFRAASHRDAWDTLAQGLQRPGAVIALTGAAGVGKTTLANAVIAEQGPAAGPVRRVSGASPEAADIVEAWRGLKRAASTPEAVPLPAGISAVDAARGAQFGILVIDDAHDLAPAALQRLSAALASEPAGQRRPHLLLIARPDLWSKLAGPTFAALRDSITVRAVLFPMPYAEAERYVEHLFALTGASARAVMAEDVLHGLIVGAQGNLRQINAGLGRALAAVRGQRPAPAASPAPPASPLPASLLPEPPPRRSRLLAAASVLAAIGLAVAAMILLEPGRTWMDVRPDPPEPPRADSATLPTIVPPPTAAEPSRLASTPRPAPLTAALPSAALGRPPQASPPSQSLPDDVVAMLLKRGDAMLELRDVSAARRLYERAARAGSARGALALGGTYDPALRADATWDLEPDPGIAAVWYQFAATLGNADARARLDRLTPGKAVK